MNNKQKIPKNNYRLNYLLPYLADFTKTLFNTGYTKLTIDGYSSSVEHFCIWLQKRSISLNKINDRVLSDFSRHHCKCPRRRRGSKISCKYIGRILHCTHWSDNLPVKIRESIPFVN